MRSLVPSRPPNPSSPRPLPGRWRTLAASVLLMTVLPALPLASGAPHPPAGSGPPVLAPSPAPAAGVWPLHPRPEVVRFFDPPSAPWAAGHRGVDLAGTVGQPVRSALAGRVVFAGRVAGRGVVVVSHGSTRTTYEPVGASVSVGDRVAAGQTIGRLQWFGSHCLPSACLHWGLLEGDRYLDPLTLVGGPEPVRLLPLGGRALLRTG